MLTKLQIGDEVSIREAEYLLPCRVREKYLQNNEVWLILVEPQTKTQFRRKEASILKEVKEIKLTEGGKF